MTQEEKSLLLKDLSARLPYNTIVSIAEGGVNGIEWNKVALNFYLLYQIEEEGGWKFVKPYLRPMSSMTTNEKVEYTAFIYSDSITVMDMINLTDWLNAHHFDYRNLIEKGLALESPEGMY